MTTEGCYIEYHEPTGRHWLYVPAGKDKDGTPLTLARVASPIEVALWEEDRKEELSIVIQSQGLPALAKLPPARASRKARKKFLLGLWARIKRAFRG